MSQGSPIRVVVVDDDPEALALVLVRLKDHPRIQIVATGNSGREAIQLANTLRPDVMVLDVMMPILNGLEAAARISAVFPSIGLLILTSDASPESIRAALRAGAKDYLDKSTELFRLADAVMAADDKRERSAPDKGLAAVWAFYGAKGSSGSTTLAVGAAHELARLGHKVVLVDLDFLHGDCGFYLNVQPTQPNLFTQLEGPDPLDLPRLSKFFKTSTAEGPAGPVSFQVLEAPGDVVRASEPVVEGLIAVMDLLVTSVDHVIVDLPSGAIFEHANIAVLDFVERLFFVTNRDMSSLRSLLTFSRVLARSTVKIARFTVLFGSLREQSTFDYQEWLTSTRLATKSLMEIPLDAKASAKAISGGVPVQVADPDGPLARFLRKMVEVGLKRGAPDTPEVFVEDKKGGLWQSLKKIIGG